MRNLRLLALSVVLASLIAALVVACGGGNGEGDAAPTRSVAPPPSPAAATPRTPVACLKRSNLFNIQKRGSHLWHGADPADRTVVLVELADSPTEAAQVAADAPRVTSYEVAGSYVVTGLLSKADRALVRGLKGSFKRGRLRSHVLRVAACLTGRYVAP